MTTPYYSDTPLTPDMLGDKVPRRHGKLSQKLASYFYRRCGWKTIGQIPNISQAVLIAVPHTSNIDGLYAIPMVVGLDLDVRIIGKKELFSVPVLAQFLRWAGIIPIDRDKKGSVLQANIERFKTGEPLFWHLPQKAQEAIPMVGKLAFIIWHWGRACPSFLWRWIMLPKKSVL